MYLDKYNRPKRHGQEKAIDNLTPLLPFWIEYNASSTTIGVIDRQYISVTPFLFPCIQHASLCRCFLFTTFFSQFTLHYRSNKLSSMQHPFIGVSPIFILVSLAYGTDYSHIRRSKLITLIIAIYVGIIVETIRIV